MTIDEALVVLNNNMQLDWWEYKQLAEWLTELKELRKARDNIVNLRHKLNSVIKEMENI